MVKISSLINNQYHYLAHPGESIEEHTQKVQKYWYLLLEQKDLKQILQQFVHVWNISDVEESQRQLIDQFIWSVMEDTITLHDIGKINPLFQRIKMKNPEFLKIKPENTLTSKHSIISAVLYLDYYLKELECLKKRTEISGKQVNRLVLLIFINSYVISRHHGDLESFYRFQSGFINEDGEYLNIIEEIIHDILPFTNPDIQLLTTNRISKYQERVNRSLSDDYEFCLSTFTYERLMFSILLACDYYATSEQVSDLSIVDFGNVGNIHNFMTVFEQTKIMKAIRQYGLNKGECDYDPSDIHCLNDLRCEIFLEAEKNIEQYLDKSILYVQAPTGMGKTNIALYLSFRLMHENSTLKKIWYIYPYNTLVEQNEEILDKTFGEHNGLMQQIHVVNSVHSMLSDKVRDSKIEISEQEYKKILLDRQFMNYPITLSTHVTLFDIMFNHRKESAFSFHQLANSVIILDEIQSYRNTIWTEIITFLNAYAKSLNIRVIIMSATLPKLDLLAKTDIQPSALFVNPAKYYSHPLYLNRSRLHYDLLEAENCKEALLQKVLECIQLKKKILVEFIKKASADEFYERMLALGFSTDHVEKITGDDNILERKRILQKVKDAPESEFFLLIATQVIEAGVDLNTMDTGFKDISSVDSEEQFMGRINRPCNMERIGDVYFFNLDDAHGIYKEDIRTQKNLTIMNSEMRDVLEQKDFDLYYSKVMNEIKKINDSARTQFSIDHFLEMSVGRMNAVEVSSRMKLIEDNQWQARVFFNRTIETEKGILCGEAIWNRYKEILSENDMEYSKKQVLLNDTRSEMSYFIYQINALTMFQYSDSEQIGDLYYIDDAEPYFEHGKFNRKSFETQYSLFL